MSYFGAQLGKRPAGEPDAAEQKKPAEVRKEERPYFAASLGPCPSKPEGHVANTGEPGAPKAPLDTPSSDQLGVVCPLCRGPLEASAGLYRCLGRCGARWLEDSPGHLVDVAALLFGVCACCQPPQALARGEHGAVCPATGSPHMLLPGGPMLLADAAPEGLCQCCAPAAALVRRDGVLVCSAKPGHHYRRAGEEVVLIAARAAPAAADALDAIDAALRRNNARLTVNGLFDLD